MNAIAVELSQPLHITPVPARRAPVSLERRLQLLADLRHAVHCIRAELQRTTPNDWNGGAQAWCERWTDLAAMERRLDAGIAKIRQPHAFEADGVQA